MSKRSREILDAAARTRIPDDVNLYPRLVAQLERKTFMKALLAKPALLILSVIFSLALLSGVVYAIGHSLGYIPGVGIVENDQKIRISPETRAESPDGVIFKMWSLTADGSQTILIYSVYNIPMQEAQQLVQEGVLYQPCSRAPAIQLPDGTTLDANNQYNGVIGGEGGLASYRARIVYPPIPEDVNEVTLLSLPPCQIPPINLQIAPAPQGMAFPATEISATSESSRPLLPTLTPGTLNTTPIVYPTNFLPTLTPVQNGSGLYLEKTIETESAYLLIGNFTDAGDLPGPAILSMIPYELSVSDRNGEPVPFWVHPELIQNSGWSNVAYWAIEVPKSVDTPLTITLPHITIHKDKTFTFPLNVGMKPTTVQTWEIDQVVQFENYSFLIENIRRDERGYTLIFNSLDSIARDDFLFIFSIAGTTGTTGNEQVHARNGAVEWTETLVLGDQIPTGELNFTLLISTEFQIGPWTLIWSPPAQ